MAEKTGSSTARTGMKRILLRLPLFNQHDPTHSRRELAVRTDIELTRPQPSMEKKEEDEVAIMAGHLPSNPARVSFFQQRRNRLVLGVCGLIMLLLTILTPALHFVFKRKAENAAAKLVEEASRYAVVNANFPDPCMIEIEDGYYAFATRDLANPEINIQVATAVESISKWTFLEGYDALPNLPAWVKNHGDAAVWAPQVTQRSDGVFVMAYSALHKDHPRKHCLGMATADNVLGPYDPGNSTEPILCHLSLGGIIDPTFLEDPISNKTYLVYKNDGNAIGSGGACNNDRWPNTPTTFQHSLLVQPSWTKLAAANNSLVPIQNATAAIDLVNNSTIFMHNAKSDGPNIESPQVWYQEYPGIGRNSTPKRAYHMLYNAGCFADKSYRTEGLVCWLDDARNITTFSDCDWQAIKKTSTHLLLQTGSYPQPDGKLPAMLLAPGGPGVTQDGRYMAFHADIVPSWFDKSHKPDENKNEHHEPGKRQNGTKPVKSPVYTRKRALFIAELEVDETNGLRISRLIEPEHF